MPLGSPTPAIQVAISSPLLSKIDTDEETLEQTTDVITGELQYRQPVFASCTADTKQASTFQTVTAHCSWMH
jgi:hypothetical protein